MNKQPRNSQHLHGFSQEGKTHTPSPLTSKTSKNALFQKHGQSGGLPRPALAQPPERTAPIRGTKAALKKVPLPDGQAAAAPGAAQLRERSLTPRAARPPRRDARPPGAPAAACFEHLWPRKPAAGGPGGRWWGEISVAFPLPPPARLRDQSPRTPQAGQVAVAATCPRPPSPSRPPAPRTALT